MSEKRVSKEKESNWFYWAIIGAVVVGALGAIDFIHE